MRAASDPCHRVVEEYDINMMYKSENLEEPSLHSNKETKIPAFAELQQQQRQLWRQHQFLESLCLPRVALVVVVALVVSSHLVVEPVHGLVQ